ncbi:TorF family putative porin [Rhodanobacter koreensis]
MAIAACLSMPLHAQSTTFTGTAALSSELIDRGQAITGNTPILQGAASWTSPAGWSLGLSGSTEVRSPGRVVEALVQASRYWSLSDDWQMQANLLYYRYPGETRSRAYDRAETGVDWTYRDVLTFGMSAIYVIGARDHQPRGAADLSFHWPLAWHFSLSAGVGVAQPLIAPYTPYGYGHAGSYSYDRTGLHGYGHAGLLWSHGPWRIELDRIMADPETRQQWANLGASPWVATISRSF